MKPNTLTIASLLSIILLIHRNNGFTAAVANSPGGVFFIWTLVALGVTGGLAIILSARGLWNLRSQKT